MMPEEKEHEEKVEAKVVTYAQSAEAIATVLRNRGLTPFEGVAAVAYFLAKYIKHDPHGGFWSTRIRDLVDIALTNGWDSPRMTDHLVATANQSLGVTKPVVTLS